MFAQVVFEIYICNTIRNAILSCMVQAAPEAAIFFNTAAMKRVIVYVDGFNFYYGIKGFKKVEPRWGNYYWIDLVKLFEQFMGPEERLEKVIYFTASQLNPKKSSRQSALFNANKILNGDRFEVVRGRYIQKPYSCPNCSFSYNIPEEKKTDVNISVRMLEDCFMDNVDILTLVTADSDLVPPMKSITTNCPDKKLRLYFPPSGFSTELRDTIFRCKGKPVYMLKNEVKFKNSIMDDVIESSDGSERSTIPTKWKMMQIK